MSANVGTLDRVVRAVLGLVLLWLAFFSGFAAFDGAVLKYGAALVGLVMLGVAVLRVCPVYSVFGLSTCKLR